MIDYIADWIRERSAVFWAICGALLVKGLMAVAEDVPPPENKRELKKRIARFLSGIAAGALMATFGTPILVNLFDWLDEGDTIGVAIFLALTGEHIVRRLLNPGAIFDLILDRALGKSS